jgi:hypothetical protein
MLKNASVHFLKNQEIHKLIIGTMVTPTEIIIKPRHKGGQ